MKWITALGTLGLLAAAASIALPLHFTWSAFADQATTQPLSFRAISLHESLPLVGRGGEISPNTPIVFGFVTDKSPRTLSPTVNMTLMLSTAFHRSTQLPSSKITPKTSDAPPPQIFHSENWTLSVTLDPNATDTLSVPWPSDLVPGIYQGVISVHLGGFSETVRETFFMDLPPLSPLESGKPSDSSSPPSIQSSPPNSVSSSAPPSSAPVPPSSSPVSSPSSGGSGSSSTSP